MAGPIGHGVAKALREARETGAYSNRGRAGSSGRGGGPPSWAWIAVAVALIAAMVWAGVTLR
ncbi:MAG TPA: hypothetical protein VM261_09185 [Kofleriaceae bacterium]|nr:hypothetical protein [Kofleriaceae bacterium]